MEEGTLQLSLVAGVREDLTQILPEDARREVRLPGVNSVRVHFRLDLVAWAVGAMVVLAVGKVVWTGKLFYSLFFSHLPANPQCCSHSPCLLSLLLATALDFLNLYDHGPLLSRAFSPALATYCCIRVFVCFLSTLVMRFILILVLAHSVSCCSILVSEYMSILYCWKMRLSPVFLLLQY